MTRAGRVILLAMMVLLVSAAPADADARVRRTVLANLDNDARVERVQLIATSRRNPFGGTVRIPVRYVRVVDRVRGQLVKRRISAKVDFARFKVRDFNRDGQRDIWFAGVSGNGGAAPQWFGLFDWTGRARRVLWHWSWRRSVVGSRWAGASVHRTEYARKYPGLELVLDEGVLSSGDPNCCPSRILVSIYAYHPAQRRYRLYDRYYKRPRGLDLF